MKAIWTKFLPATNFRGARIKAETEGGSITISFDYNGREHDDAAIALVKKMQWDYPSSSHPSTERIMLSGGRPDGRGNVYVFLESGRIAIPVVSDEKQKTRTDKRFAKPKCSECGELFPCSDSKRRDIDGLIRARHHI